MMSRRQGWKDKEHATDIPFLNFPLSDQNHHESFMNHDVGHSSSPSIHSSPAWTSDHSIDRLSDFRGY